mgnify:CR=1 FL=1
MGYFKAHRERTHPVPAARGFACYSCHRSGATEGVDVSSGTCNRCHYNSQDYEVNRDLEANDFPHSGYTNEYKLLGAYSIDSAPPGDGGTGWSVNFVETTITADNLDAVCIRCHTDQGVHQ